MKKVLFSICFLAILSLQSFSQNDNKQQHEKFSIISFGKVKDVAFYTRAVNGANLENWRLQDKRTLLKFDTDFEIELLSANELKKKGFHIELSSYKTDFPALYTMPVFNVFPDGKLGAVVSPPTK